MSGKVKNTVNPLGTDSIPGLIARFAIPSAVALVVNALYNIVDQIFIGWSVGYLGNGATNVIFPLTVFVLSLSSMLGDGCSSYMSLELGKGDKESASQGVCNTLPIAILMGIVLAALSLIFLEPLCRLFGATDNNLPYAMEYGRIIAVGFPFAVIDSSMTAVVRADGSPRYSMIGLFIGCGTNLILDPVLIFGFDMGMTGAAVATILGEIFNAVFLLFYLPRFRSVSIRKKYMRTKAGTMGKVLSLGASSFILQFSIVLMITCSNKLLVKYGALSKYGADIPIAAMGIAMKVNQIVVNIVQGIATGSQPIIGYNYGAKKYERTKQAFKIVVISSVTAMTIAFIIFEFFPMAVVSLFGSESELYNEFAVKCFRIYLCLCILNGFQMPVGFFFQAVGKPVLSSVNTLAKQVVIILPAMFILSAITGVEGPLWAGPVSDGLAFILSVILLKVNWKKIFPESISNENS